MPPVTPPAGPLHGRDVIAPHVDDAFYRARYPDIARSGVDPVTHYLLRGWREGRNPNSWFDTVSYLQRYPDVYKGGMNPLEHYVRHGHAGGRQPRATDDASGLERRYDDPELAALAEAMDIVYYRGTYPDIDHPDLDPVQHFHRAGWREGRKPNTWFDPAYYLATYPDIRDAGIDPLLHYVRDGRREGRLPAPPGGYRRAVADAAMAPADRKTGYDAPAQAPMLGAAELRALLSDACAGARGLVVAASHDRYIDLVGGVQIFISDEQALFNADRFAYLHIAPTIARLTLDTTGGKPATMQVVIDGVFVGLATYATLEEVLEALPPDEPSARVFVVHSLFGHRVANLAAIAEKLRAQACCFWLHDYASVCEGYNLLRDDIEFCQAPPLASGACRICVYGPNRAAYRDEVRALFTRLPFDVLAPSRAALEWWRRGAELPHRSARLHPHCRYVPAPVDAAAVPPAIPSDGVLNERVRVAYAGYPLPHKGWPLFMDLFRAAQPLGPYEFYHFCTQASRQPMRGLVSVATQVDRDHRSAMITALAEHRIDLVLVLSPWPETFSFVTYEAFAAGADVVALANSGNVADAIRAEDRGVVLRDAAALLGFFTELDAVRYVMAQRQAGRRPGSIQLEGTTATYDPAAPGTAEVPSPGLPATSDPDLGVIADGVALGAERDGVVYHFDLPAGAERVRVVSRSLQSMTLRAQAAERRRLGVAVRRLSLDGEIVPPRDARRASGWHDPDGAAAEWQWTDGNATLLTGGARRLEIVLEPKLNYQRCPLGIGTA